MKIENQESVPVQIDKEKIKLALQHDREFFIQFFLGTEIDLPVPKFHPEIFSLMVDTTSDKFACAVPRDHAKTTLAKLTAVWYMLFSDFRFILYMSNTVTIAVPSVNDVIGFLECDNFRAVYGELVWHTRQDGKGIYKFNIGKKLVILRAHGAGMQVRGINIDNQRPQLLICDDIEDAVNIATPELFMKLKRWFYGPLKKAMDKFNHKIIHIGNLVENRCLIAEHCNSKYWSSRIYGCLLSNGESLWPDAWPIDKLKIDFMEYLEAGLADVWFAEMMNMPTAGGNGIIKAEEIYYQPPRIPEDVEFGFITIDLAISEHTWAHKTVVAVHGFISDAGANGIWQSVDYSGYHGIDPINLFWEVIKFCKKWKIHTVGIEAVAYQAALLPVFEHECLRNGITGIEFVPLMATGRKAQRIITWASMVKAKEYALTHGDFTITQELLTFRPDKKENTDDHIDCHAYVPQMLNKFMHLIMSEYKVNTHNEIQGSYSICEV